MIATFAARVSFEIILTPNGVKVSTSPFRRYD